MAEWAMCPNLHDSQSDYENAIELYASVLINGCKHLFKRGIEHNYNEVERNKIYNLLTKHNYSRVLEEVSCWDDWYVRNDLIN
jgi:uncharacterized protein YutE (UPF0331/DUF86 family)